MVRISSDWIAPASDAALEGVLEDVLEGVLEGVLEAVLEDARADARLAPKTLRALASTTYLTTPSRRSAGSWV